MRTLSHREARAYYDRFGARQDTQAFYEDRAIEELIERSEFSRARRVLEFGCGTGRLAARLLSQDLRPDARYLGVDVSQTMVGLARSRLEPFGDRAEVRLSDGQVRLPVSDGSVDRVLATYVADLLSDADIGRLLDEARRALAPGGLLCCAGLTDGASVLGRLVSRLWTAVHAVHPEWVGGCRPLRLAPRLRDGGWSIAHDAVVRAFGLSSEVLVATPRPVR